MSIRQPLLFALLVVGLVSLLLTRVLLADQGPLAPTNVHATQGQYLDRVVVSWDASAGADALSYQVWRCREDGGSGERLLAEPSASPLEDTTVVPGVVYRYYVKACDGATCGPASAPTTGWAAAGDAYEPDDTRASASPIASGETQDHTIVPDGDADWATLALTTTASIEVDVQAYGVAMTVSLYNESGVLIEQATTDGMSATFETVIDIACDGGGLAPGRYDFEITGEVVYVYDAYRLRLRVVDCSHVEPPAPPEGVVASDGEHMSCVTVAWEASDGAGPVPLRYQVYRAVSADGLYQQIGETTATTLDDCNVMPGDLYHYAVAACTDQVCSALSQSDAGYAGALGGPTDPYEPDDSMAQAHEISSGATQTHALAPVGDADWLTFYVPATSYVALTVYHPEPIISEVVLYTAGGMLVERREQVGGAHIERLCGDDPLPAGRYYAQIQEANGGQVVPTYYVTLEAYTCMGQEPVNVWVVPYLVGR